MDRNHIDFFSHSQITLMPNMTVICCLLTANGEQTRDWFVLPAMWSALVKLSSKYQNAAPWERGSNSECRVGTWASPGWPQVSNQTKRVCYLVGQSILMWQGVQPSKIKAWAWKPGPATVPIPRNIPLMSLQGSSKLNAITEISNTPKQRYKYRGKL